MSIVPIIHSQEKQNDATWEETLAFLNKYKSHIIEIGTYGHHNTFKISSITFDDDMLNVLVEYGQIGSGKWITKKVKNIKYYADLRLLMSAEEVAPNSGYLKLNFSEKTNFEGYVMDLRNDKTDYEYKSGKGFSWFILGFKTPEVFKSSEMFKRYLKALKHLAYLAEKKREKARRSKGDKF